MCPPSSTAATNGSIKSSTYSKSSKIKDTSKSTTNSNHNSGPSSSLSETSLPSGSPELSEERNADYLANSVDPVPNYQYTSTEESVHAHKTSMKSYLDDFDNNMAQYEA